MPFSVDDFFAVFSTYLAAIWPAQIRADELIFTILSGMWGLNSIGYHLIHSSTINPAARVFGAFFVLRAALLPATPFRYNGEFVFGAAGQLRKWTARALIAFAMLLYPVIGVLTGHSYPAVPVSGVAPGPTTIFTIGVLLAGDWKRVRWLLIIPAVWSVIGGSATVLLSVPQDDGLIAAGLIVLGLARAGHRIERGKLGQQHPGLRKSFDAGRECNCRFHKAGRSDNRTIRRIA